MLPKTFTYRSLKPVYHWLHAAQAYHVSWDVLCELPACDAAHALKAAHAKYPNIPRGNILIETLPTGA